MRLHYCQVAHRQVETGVGRPQGAEPDLFPVHFPQALRQLHADYEANGSGIVPLMFEDGQVYDCS